ncbi:MAG: 2'-5' RNA ligase family protein [Saprospiraceae bacterium]|nr:2'-5' RNA ligase family protein [Saprospiraceae bacterium]
MTSKRIQLTLFADPLAAGSIENIRRQYNPEQFALIAAHVTLCREDELDALEHILQNLESAALPAIRLTFGPPRRFSDGKGVLLPALGDNDAFQDLRARVLQGVFAQPRRHEPHLTLMHPRNSTCTDEVFAEIEKNTFPRSVEFHKISLIEQKIGQKWSVLQEFELKKAKPL